MSNELQTWWVRAMSGEDFDVDGVSSVSSHGDYVFFTDKNDNVQASFYRPEFYARTSILEDEWE